MGPEGELLIRERLKRAKKEGDLPDGANPPELARYASTIMQGMAVRAAGGAGHKELRAIAAMALNAWPERAELDGARAKSLITSVSRPDGRSASASVIGGQGGKSGLLGSTVPDNLRRGRPQG